MDSPKGSHVKLRKIVGGRKLTVIVPLHNELADGTLLSILKMACISMDDFLEAL